MEQTTGGICEFNYLQVLHKSVVDIIGPPERQTLAGVVVTAEFNESGLKGGGNSVDGVDGGQGVVAGGKGTGGGQTLAGAIGRVHVITRQVALEQLHVEASEEGVVVVVCGAVEEGEEVCELRVLKLKTEEIRQPVLPRGGGDHAGVRLRRDDGELVCGQLGCFLKQQPANTSTLQNVARVKSQQQQPLQHDTNVIKLQNDKRNKKKLYCYAVHWSVCMSA